MKVLSIFLLAILFLQFSDAFFLFKKKWHFVRHESDDSDDNTEDNTEDNDVVSNGGGGGKTSEILVRLLPVLLDWVTKNKPELLPKLLDFAIANPQILNLLTGPSSGGKTKRDTTSQVEYNTNEETPDQTIVRRMFEFVLENDSDDCFKKYVCGLAREANPSNSTLSAIEEENETASIRQECSSKFAKCSFKEYKTRDTITVLSDRQMLRQISEEEP